VPFSIHSESGNAAITEFNPTYQGLLEWVAMPDAGDGCGTRQHAIACPMG